MVMSDPWLAEVSLGKGVGVNLVLILLLNSDIFHGHFHLILNGIQHEHFL